MAGYVELLIAHDLLEDERDRLRAEVAELVTALVDCRQWLTAFARGGGHHTHKDVVESDRYARYGAVLAKHAL